MFKTMRCGSQGGGCTIPLAGPYCGANPSASRRPVSANRVARYPALAPSQTSLLCFGRKGWRRSELAPMINVYYNSLHVKPHFQFGSAVQYLDFENFKFVMGFACMCTRARVCQWRNCLYFLKGQRGGGGWGRPSSGEGGGGKRTASQ